MLRGFADRGPVAPAPGQCHALVREDQPCVVNPLGFDRNKEGSHIAIVSGGTVDPTFGCEMAVERLGRVVAPKPILYMKLAKVASMQSITKIVGNSRNQPQLIEIDRPASLTSSSIIDVKTHCKILQHNRTVPKAVVTTSRRRMVSIACSDHLSNGAATRSIGGNSAASSMSSTNRHFP